MRAIPSGLVLRIFSPFFLAYVFRSLVRLFFCCNSRLAYEEVVYGFYHYT